MQVLHADFAYTLCVRILSILFPADPTTTTPNAGALAVDIKSDPSYEMCLARWVMWSLDTWSNPNSSTEGEMDVDLRKDIAVSLMQELGHRMGDPRTKENKAYVRTTSI